MIVKTAFISKFFIIWGLVIAEIDPKNKFPWLFSNFEFKQTMCWQYFVVISELLKGDSWLY